MTSTERAASNAQERHSRLHSVGLRNLDVQHWKFQGARQIWRRVRKRLRVHCLTGLIERDRDGVLATRAHAKNRNRIAAVLRGFRAETRTPFVFAIANVNRGIERGIAFETYDRSKRHPAARIDDELGWRLEHRGRLTFTSNQSN
jgi:hypothetical protein